MKFSIIVPIYNTEKYLGACIDSILNQSFLDFELILVNDGSNDSSLSICQDFVSKYSNIVLINKKNGGLSSARNAGIKMAKGDYIIFIDSDDLYLNNFGFQNISNCLDFDKKSIVFWKYKKSDFRIVNYTKKKADYLIAESNEEKIKLLKNGTIVASACCCCIPRCFFSDKLFFVEGDYSEDIEWFFALLKIKANWILCDDGFYGYRTRPGSISNSVSRENINHIERHIDNMICDLVSNENNSLLLVFIGEQVANYYIAFSRSLTDYDPKSNYIYYLKYSKRARSRVIHFLIHLLGMRFTLKLLRRIK